MFRRLYHILRQRAYVFSQRNRTAQGKVYMFHEIGDKADPYSISKDHFRSFLQYLQKNKKIVDAKTLISQKDPDNVVLSFDDVYLNVYEEAYPLLKQLDVPFYLFVCAEYLGKEGYLGADELKEMLASGKAILGSHGLKHELSRFRKAADLKDDLLAAKEQLETLSGRKVEAFAFPYGSMYACSKENIKTASSIFQEVFMTYPLAYNERDGRVIPRINMNDGSFGKEMA